MYVYRYICIDISVFIDVHIYIYTYINIYVYTHIFIFICYHIVFKKVENSFKFWLVFETEHILRHSIFFESPRKCVITKGTKFVRPQASLRVVKVP